MKKYKIKDKLQSISNIIYGDNAPCAYQNIEEANKDLESKIEQLNEIYENLEYDDDRYILGDIINLLNNIVFEEEN
jgi:uncharacterized protein YPO0396